VSCTTIGFLALTLTVRSIGGVALLVALVIFADVIKDTPSYIGRLLRSLLRRPEVLPDYSERAFPRSRREYHELWNTLRFTLWLGVTAILGGSIGIWLSWGHARAATVVITALAAFIGLAGGFGLPFLWLWISAPVVQRDEARHGLVVERQAAKAQLQSEVARLEERIDAERQAFDDKWREAEDLRGHLGTAKHRIEELEAAIPVGVGEATFPVVFDTLSMGQDDDEDARNTRIVLNLRAINRSDQDASLIFHLGIGRPGSHEVVLWQQAREPGAPLTVFSVLLGRADPIEIQAKKWVDVKPEFMLAKTYLEGIRHEPPRMSPARLGSVRLDALWLRAQDLISGTIVEKRLPLHEV